MTASLMCCEVTGQTVAINGLVADSATFKALAGVNLQIKNHFRGTITNDKGYFSMSLNENDSVIFTCIGYHTKVVSVKRILLAPVIFLREANAILREITISSAPEILGIPKIPKERIWINPTYTPAYTKTPGIPNMQNFGPSVIIKGIFSRFNKYEKELKKLPKVKKENDQAKNFLSVINDSLFMNNFINLYHISQEDYWNSLELFNQKYGNTLYELPPDELTSLLHLFYSENRKHGRTK